MSLEQDTSREGALKARGRSVDDVGYRTEPPLISEVAHVHQGTVAVEVGVGSLHGLRLRRGTGPSQSSLLYHHDTVGCGVAATECTCLVMGQCFKFCLEEVGNKIFEKSDFI